MSNPTPTVSTEQILISDSPDKDPSVSHYQGQRFEFSAGSVRSFHPPVPPDSKSKGKKTAQESPPQPSAKKSAHPLVPLAPKFPHQKGISLGPGSKKTPASNKPHSSLKPSVEVMKKYFRDPTIPTPFISSELPQEFNEAFADENLPSSIPDDPKTIRSLQQALLLLPKVKGGTTVAVETNIQLVNLSIKIEEMHQRKRLYQSSQEFYKAQLTQLTDLEAKKNSLSQEFVTTEKELSNQVSQLELLKAEEATLKEQLTGIQSRLKDVTFKIGSLSKHLDAKKEFQISLYKRSCHLDPDIASLAQQKLLFEMQVGLSEKNLVVVESEWRSLVEAWQSLKPSKFQDKGDSTADSKDFLRAAIGSTRTALSFLPSPPGFEPLGGDTKDLLEISAGTKFGEASPGAGFANP